MRRRIHVMLHPSIYDACHIRRKIPVHHGRYAGEREGGLGDRGSKYNSSLSARVRIIKQFFKNRLIFEKK